MKDRLRKIKKYAVIITFALGALILMSIFYQLAQVSTSPVRLSEQREIHLAKPYPIKAGQRWSDSTSSTIEILSIDTETGKLEGIYYPGITEEKSAPLNGFYLNGLITWSAPFPSARNKRDLIISWIGRAEYNQQGKPEISAVWISNISSSPSKAWSGLGTGSGMGASTYHLIPNKHKPI